MRFFFFALDNT